MSNPDQRRDFRQAAGAFLWTIEPRSAAMRSRRHVALVLALLGPKAWNVRTLAEVAQLETMSERTLRSLRSELRLVYGLAPPVAVFAARFEGANSMEDATAPDFAAMATDSDDGFFADDPQDDDGNKNQN